MALASNQGWRPVQAYSLEDLTVQASPTGADTWWLATEALTVGEILLECFLVIVTITITYLHGTKELMARTFNRYTFMVSISTINISFQCWLNIVQQTINYGVNPCTICKRVIMNHWMNFKPFRHKNRNTATYYSKTRKESVRRLQNCML